MTIREYAKSVGHEIIGKLTRNPKHEYTIDFTTGEKAHSGFKHYSDEANNEYIVGKKSICIVTIDGAII